MWVDRVIVDLREKGLYQASKRTTGLRGGNVSHTPAPHRKAGKDAEDEQRTV